jgi:hypothetical protein
MIDNEIIPAVTKTGSEIEIAPNKPHRAGPIMNPIPMVAPI